MSKRKHEQQPGETRQKAFPISLITTMMAILVALFSGLIVRDSSDLPERVIVVLSAVGVLGAISALKSATPKSKKVTIVIVIVVGLYLDIASVSRLMLSGTGFLG